MRAVWVGLMVVGTPAAVRAQGVAVGGAAGLQRQIEAMAAEPAVARAHWGVAVTTMEGAPLAEVNAGQFFQPASNAKLYTTAAAMALLGADATAETRVIGAGSVAAGTLTGDLVLVGAGNANLAVDDVPYVPTAAMKARREAEAVAGSPAAAAKADREAHPLRQMEALADQVVKAGVTTVTGDVVGDDTAFAAEPYPEAWGIDDMVWGYGAPVSALSVHDNQIVVRVQPGAAVGEPGVVVMEAGLPQWYTLEASGLRTGAAKSGTHVGMDRAAGARTLRVWGTIAVDAKEDVEEVAIDEPAEFAARALKGMLEARGVAVKGVARARHRLPVGTRRFQEEAREALPVAGTGREGTQASAQIGQVLATVRSPELVDDEVLTNKVSQNLHAELLLERLGAAFGDAGSDTGSRAEGARVVRSFLDRAGVDRDDVVFFDGSGLSAHDLVTPRATATLLRFVATQPWFAGWKASLPVGGVDGSLSGRFAKAPLQGKVFAKTGTLGEARALSGYVQCASGRTVVFSIMVDLHAPGSSADREVMDRMVAAVYAAE